MNILLINHYAGSPKMGMEYRPYYLAKEWIKLGHNVTILVANNSHIRQYNPKMSSNFKEEIIDGIKYAWIKTPSYKGNGFGRIKNIFAFVWKVYKKAKLLSKKYIPDVVIASSTYPSDNYIAKKIAKLSNAKYIYEVHDLWPLSPMELGGMSKYHPFIMFMQHGENFAYKNSDAVISMLPKTQDHMQKHGLDLKKWNHIPNGIVVDDWKQLNNLNHKIFKFCKQLKAQNKIIIGYTGGHAISNSLNTIIDTAKDLKKDTNIHFVFIGNGDQKENLISKTQDLKNITFFDSIPKDQIPQALSLFNILILSWNKSSIYRFGISPNKIFDYMMAKKPIIHATDAPNTFVDIANCGIAVEPENPKAISDAINKLISLPKEELEKMGQNGYDFVIKNHDYKILAKKFIEVIK